MIQGREEIKIKISKIKSVFMTLFALVILSGAIWFWLKAIHISGFNRTFLIICTSLLIIVFGIAFIVGIMRIFDTKSGLTLTKDGIYINFGPASGYFVKWNKISDLKTSSAPQGPIVISIYVDNPNEYLDKAKGLKKFKLKMNNTSHGTPLSIATNWLKCNYIDLFEEMSKRIEKVE